MVLKINRFQTMNGTIYFQINLPAMISSLRILPRNPYFAILFRSKFRTSPIFTVSAVRSTVGNKAVAESGILYIFIPV